MEGAGIHASTELYVPGYRLGRFIRVDSVGKVKAATHGLTGRKVSIKILCKARIRAMDMQEKVRKEIEILRLLTHPNIIQLHEVIDTDTHIFLVMEYLNSELFDYSIEKGRLHEDEACQIFQQIIHGVEYCHKRTVVHCDLRLENILLDSRCNVKICDFGMSNVMYDGKFLNTGSRSSTWAAPEVISGNLYLGPEVDVWNCGVILYALLCGYFPYQDEHIPDLYKRIQDGIYTLPSHLSMGARDLITQMLLTDPSQRLTIPKIKRHPWFQCGIPSHLVVPPLSDATKKADRLQVQQGGVIVKVLKTSQDPVISWKRIGNNMMCHCFHICKWLEKIGFHFKTTILILEWPRYLYLRFFARALKWIMEKGRNVMRSD